MGRSRLDVNIFADAWKKREQANLTETQKFWDLRAEEFNQLTLENEQSKNNDDVIEFLLSKDALQSDFEVLDIGCGAGKYSIAFAGMVRSVTGIDISPKMIAFSKENMEAKGLKNGQFHTIPWQSLDIKEWGWEKKFDLVFASMSPAVNDAETLLKMNTVSRKHCFMSGFVYREDKIKNYLINKLGWEIKKYPPSNIYYAFNILWQKGIYSDIAYQDREWTKNWPLEQAVEIYSYQLRSFSSDQLQLQEKIKRYLEEISNEGMVEENMKAKTAWLYWQVPSI